MKNCHWNRHRACFFFLNILATGEEEQENQRTPVLFSVKEEITTAPGLHTL